MRENIFNREPGRDLDIEVATRVMGFIWLKHLLQFSAELAVKWLGTAADIEQSGGVYVRLEKESEMISLKLRENFAEAVPCYSTELKAARQVVERMESLGYIYIFEEKVEQEQRIYFGSFIKDNIGFEARAGCRSEAEAIVKAALTALA